MLQAAGPIEFRLLPRAQGWLLQTDRTNELNPPFTALLSSPPPPPSLPMCSQHVFGQSPANPRHHFLSTGVYSNGLVMWGGHLDCPNCEMFFSGFSGPAIRTAGCPDKIQLFVGIFLFCLLCFVFPRCDGTKWSEKNKRIVNLDQGRVIWHQIKQKGTRWHRECVYVTMCVCVYSKSAHRASHIEWTRSHQRNLGGKNKNILQVVYRVQFFVMLIYLSRLQSSLIIKVWRYLFQSDAFFSVYINDKGILVRNCFTQPNCAFETTVALFSLYNSLLFCFS